jgi:hypothetical protein
MCTVRCRHCNTDVTFEMVEMTVAAGNMLSNGYFNANQPYAAQLPLRNRLRLCLPCGERLQSAIDGTDWSDEDDDEVVGHLTPVDA